MQIEQQRLQYESISIELTKQCNLECPYCYSRLKKKEEEHQLTTEQLCFFWRNSEAPADAEFCSQVERHF